MLQKCYNDFKGLYIVEFGGTMHGWKIPPAQGCILLQWQSLFKNGDKMGVKLIPKKPLIYIHKRTTIEDKTVPSSTIGFRIVDTQYSTNTYPQLTIFTTDGITAASDLPMIDGKDLFIGGYYYYVIRHRTSYSAYSSATPLKNIVANMNWTGAGATSGYQDLTYCYFITTSGRNITCYKFVKTSSTNYPRLHHALRTVNDSYAGGSVRYALHYMNKLDAYVADFTTIEEYVKSNIRPEGLALNNCDYYFTNYEFTDEDLKAALGITRFVTVEY